ncbi:Soluble lytic murein transglycosylase precursor [Serratia odorifera]|uniref:Soluble lytic murein transglycosylase n=1 Tax=Serratia odorifera TaxID=618 RepID=A0A3S4DFF3_SEROD|nr:Soluble lytic murein transglycosylase precursor [Serratia odorifera]
MVKVDKWRFLAVGLCLTAFSGMAAADSLDAQRQRYQQIKQAWDNQQMDVVAQLMPTLRDYPLYPYLEYRQLTQDLGSVGYSQVSTFIQQHPTLPPAKSLSSRFVNELARREDWRTLLTFSPQAPKPVAARCNYYYAKWGNRRSPGRLGRHGRDLAVWQVVAGRLRQAVQRLAGRRQANAADHVGNA